MQPFVAVVSGPLAPGQALLDAGARAVISWPEVPGSDQPDDLAAVLLDGSWIDDDAGLAELDAVLSALGRIEHSPSPDPGTVVVTTWPVTDTLKLVDGEGTLTGTADRDDHRFVGPPIAAPLRLLRAVSQAGPDPIAVIAALAGRGAAVIAARPQLSAAGPRPAADPRRT
jgi:2-C-methyl-D-erythritol 4-phosphate cytidylyltransferase